MVIMFAVVMITSCFEVVIMFAVVRITSCFEVLIMFCGGDDNLLF